MAGNDALSINRPVADIDITTPGSDFLWAVFAAMFASGLGLTAWTLTLHPGRRTFHFLGIAILFTASVAYFSMAADLGATAIPVEFVRNKADLYTGPNPSPTRSIWYVRYIDWVVTTPLLLLTLLLATGLPLSHIFFTIFMDEVMIITGLVGALVQSRYKWSYFTFGCVAMLYVFWVLVGPARSAAKFLGNDNHSAYVRGALTLSFLWLIYPIAWGLADGGNVISVNSEMIMYGILDFLAKPGFIFLHLIALRKIDYERFGLQSGHASLGLENGGTGHATNGYGHEKKTHAAAPTTATSTSPTTVEPNHTHSNGTTGNTGTGNGAPNYVAEPTA